MSYTRNYSETVRTVVSKTVRYNYPASQNGGSGSVFVEIEAAIPVDVNIHVDTDSFDYSVDNCVTDVNLLTASVVATEVAQIESKDISSKKVADSVIDGFFGLIRSEISQQISELTQNIDAQLMYLKESVQACLAKKLQMESDFNRISGRYVKIFTDLNSELSNRIFELDKPAFAFKRESASQRIRTSDNDLVNTVAIFGTESGEMQSKICTSIAKRRAFDTLNKAKIFLWQQKKLNQTVQQSMLNESKSGSIYSPICFIETQNVNNQIEKNVFSSDYLSMINNTFQKNKIVEQFSSNSISWTNLTQEGQKKISLYFNTELNNKVIANDQHTVRVREMIQKIATLGSIKAINYQ